jgi:hypothetical protein
VRLYGPGSRNGNPGAYVMVMMLHGGTENLKVLHEIGLVVCGHDAA